MKLNDYLLPPLIKFYLNYHKLLVMLLFFCFMIILGSSSSDIVRVIIKDSDSNWFSETIEYCKVDLGNKSFNNNIFTEESLITFITNNYTTSLKFILDIIFVKNFETKLNQRRLILIVTDIDKESTTLVSDIITPYKNIFHFDVNKNNYDVSYQQQSYHLYNLFTAEDLSRYIIGESNVTNLISIAKTTEKLEDDMLNFYEYAIKNADICIIKYIVDFENKSHVSMIVKELASLKREDKFDILFEASYTDLTKFLNVCETFILKIGTIYLNSVDISLNNVQYLLNRYKTTAHTFLAFNNINESRSIFCLNFMTNYSQFDLFWYDTQLDVYNFTWSNNGSSRNIAGIKNDNIFDIVAPKCNPITCPPGFEQKEINSNTNKKKTAVEIMCSLS